MVRKRLSDLLREEVKKPQSSEQVEEQQASDAAVDQGGDTAADAKPTPAVAKSRSRKTPSSAQAAQPNPGSTAAADTQAAAIAPPTAPPLENPLTAVVAELKANLATTQQRELTWQQQLEEVRSQLHDEQLKTQHLQTQIETIDSLKTELEEAKQVIVQLSHLNQELNQQLTQKSQTSALTPASANPEAAAQLKLTVPSKPPVLPAQTPIVNRELRKILHHPIPPSQPSTTLSDADIGWVD